MLLLFGHSSCKFLHPWRWLKPLNGISNSLGKTRKVHRTGFIPPVASLDADLGWLSEHQLWICKYLEVHFHCTLCILVYCYQANRAPEAWRQLGAEQNWAERTTSGPVVRCFACWTCWKVSDGTQVSNLKELQSSTFLFVVSSAEGRDRVSMLKEGWYSQWNDVKQASVFDE